MDNQSKPVLTEEPAGVPLQAWIDAHPRDVELIYGRAGVAQAVYFRDVLARLVARSYEEWQTCATVISEHTSTSVRLPVVRLRRPGLSVVVRDNFHSVAISVQRTRRLSGERSMVRRLVCEGFERPVAAVYCEGFPRDLVFGPYAASRRQFTVHVRGQYDAHAFLAIVTAAVSP